MCQRNNRVDSQSLGYTHTFIVIFVTELTVISLYTYRNDHVSYFVKQKTDTRNINV